MEMTYDGALVMPMGCAIMEVDEMSYCEGGKTVTMNNVPYSTAKNYLVGMQVQCRAASIAAGVAGIMSSSIPFVSALVGAGALVTSPVFWSWADAYGNALNALADISKKKKINIKEKTSGLTLAVSVAGV